MDMFDIWFEKSLIRAKSNPNREVQLYNESLLTQKYLKNILFYSPETGMFIWLVNKAHYEDKGREAGSYLAHGYIEITINGIRYKAHNLAWFYMTGEWPKQIIDHRDLNGLNNAWLNLRECTQSQNLMNRRKQNNNTSNWKGVYRNSKLKNKFEAKLGLNG